MTANLRWYAALASLPFPPGFRRKTLFIAFIGTHVPLLAIIGYLAWTQTVGERWPIIVIGLLATLAGTAVTMATLAALTAPILLASAQLRSYLDGGDLPHLPTDLPDEPGQLLADIQRTVQRLNDLARTLERAAHTDHLTGAYNRLYAEQRVADEISEGPVTLALADLDHFKQINDLHGHGTGDLVIATVVRTVQAAVRSQDWVARWGGDELLIAISTGDARQAVRVLERVRRAVRDLRIAADNGTVPISLSIGAVTCAAGDSLGDAITLADAALYRAKRSGRNSVRLDDFRALPEAELVGTPA